MPQRPRDIIDEIEKIAAANGSIEAVDEDYYEAFLQLSNLDVERMTVSLLLDQERGVRQMVESSSETNVIKVARMISNIMVAISMGLARFDGFGRLVFVARIGPEPVDVDMQDDLDARLAELKPVITNTVRKALPWLLSKHVTQRDLPL